MSIDTNKQSKVCNVEYCERKLYAKGLCNLHYNQLRTHGKLTPELERAEYVAGGRICAENGCDKPAIGKGLCRTHYQYQYRTNLSPDTQKLKIKTEPMQIEDDKDTEKPIQQTFTGKLTLNIPPEIHAAIATASELEGKTIDHWVAKVLARYIFSKIK